MCAQLCLTLCDPVDCSLQCSFVHGIFQARILKWVAISSSKGSSQARNWTHINLCILHFRRILYPLSHQKEQPYDPVIPSLGMYLGKMKTLIKKDACTSMFTVALFTIANLWKQPKCPSTDDWIQMWGVFVCVCVYTNLLDRSLISLQEDVYIHTHIRLLLSYKKEWNFVICSNMNSLAGYYDKWYKSNK